MEECGLRDATSVVRFFAWLWLMGCAVLGYLVLFGCVVVFLVRVVVVVVARLVRCNKPSFLLLGLVMRLSLIDSVV